ncbi:MAG: cell division protein FtsL [Treponema sp.]|nr:cell division protein FtsL [Treponema sp.]
MFRQCIFLYFIVLSIPLLLGITVWQSARYTDLERQVRTLEADQERWIENNERLIADIAVLTSSETVESVAILELGLEKIKPENVLQVWIDRR